MADAIRSDNELAKAVSVMGTHYPVASMGSPNASMLGTHTIGILFESKIMYFRNTNVELRRQ